MSVPFFHGAPDPLIVVSDLSRRHGTHLVRGEKFAGGILARHPGGHSGVAAVDLLGTLCLGFAFLLVESAGGGKGNAALHLLPHLFWQCGKRSVGEKRLKFAYLPGQALMLLTAFRKLGAQSLQFPAQLVGGPFLRRRRYFGLGRFRFFGDGGDRFFGHVFFSLSCSLFCRSRPASSRLLSRVLPGSCAR